MIKIMRNSLKSVIDLQDIMITHQAGSPNPITFDGLARLTADNIYDLHSYIPDADLKLIFSEAESMRKDPFLYQQKLKNFNSKPSTEENSLSDIEFTKSLQRSLARYRAFIAQDEYVYLLEEAAKYAEANYQDLAILSRIESHDNESTVDGDENISEDELTMIFYDFLNQIDEIFTGRSEEFYNRIVEELDRLYQV